MTTFAFRWTEAVIRSEYADSYAIRYVNNRELLFDRKATGEEAIQKNYNNRTACLVKDFNAGPAVWIL